MPFRSNSIMEIGHAELFGYQMQSNVIFFSQQRLKYKKHIFLKFLQNRLIEYSGMFINNSDTVSFNSFKTIFWAYLINKTLIKVCMFVLQIQLRERDNQKDHNKSEQTINFCDNFKSSCPNFPK